MTTEDSKTGRGAGTRAVTRQREVAAIAALLWALGAGALVAFGLWRGQVLPAFLSYQLGCAAFVMALRVPWGLRPGWRRLVALVGGAAVLVEAAIRVPGAAPLLEATATTLAAQAGSTAAWWGLVAAFVLVNPWVEEGFWRGALLSASVNRRLGRRPAAALAALGFLGHHAAVLHAAAGLAALGWLLPLAAASTAAVFWVRRTGRLLDVALFHAAVDAFLVLRFAAA